MQEETSGLTFGQKYVKGKPCKPYNSTLGEFFRVCTMSKAGLQHTDVGSVTGKSRTHILP